MADVEPDKSVMVKYFQDAFLRRDPNSTPQHLDSFFASVSDTLDDLLGGDSIDFAEYSYGEPDDPADLGSALIFAGDRLYRVGVRDDGIKTEVIGELPGGSYSEELRLVDGQVVETTMLYEHPRLKGSLVFRFEPRRAARFAALRRGLRVWGGRTLSS